MELYGVPAAPDPPASGRESAGEDVLNLGAWFQKGWNGAAAIGEKGTDLIAGMFDRLFEESRTLKRHRDGHRAA